MNRLREKLFIDTTYASASPAVYRGRTAISHRGTGWLEPVIPSDAPDDDQERRGSLNRANRLHSLPVKQKNLLSDEEDVLSVSEEEDDRNSPGADRIFTTGLPVLGSGERPLHGNRLVPFLKSAGMRQAGGPSSREIGNEQERRADWLKKIFCCCLWRSKKTGVAFSGPLEKNPRFRRANEIFYGLLSAKEGKDLTSEYIMLAAQTAVETALYRDGFKSSNKMKIPLNGADWGKAMAAQQRRIEAAADGVKYARDVKWKGDSVQFYLDVGKRAWQATGHNCTDLSVAMIVLLINAGYGDIHLLNLVDLDHAVVFKGAAPSQPACFLKDLDRDGIIGDVWARIRPCNAAAYPQHYIVKMHKWSHDGKRVQDTREKSQTCGRFFDPVSSDMEEQLHGRIEVTSFPASKRSLV